MSNDLKFDVHTVSFPLTLDELSVYLNEKYKTKITKYKTCLIFHIKKEKDNEDCPHRYRVSVIEEISNFFIYAQKVWVIPGEFTGARTVVSKISQPQIRSHTQFPRGKEPTEIYDAISFTTNQGTFPRDDPYLPIVQKYKHCDHTDVIFFKDFYERKITFQGNVPGDALSLHHWRFSLTPIEDPERHVYMRFIWYIPGDKKKILFREYILESEITATLDDIFNRQLSASIASSIAD